jgi:hypothetical protein
MAGQRYFDIIPNFKYLNPSPEGGKRDQYIEAKNLFMRIKIKDAVSGSLTTFDGYSIKDGERPDSIAEELYGDAGLDWVILLAANITNVQDQWPLSSRVLFDIASEKYGNDLNAIHHYETVETRDSKGRLLIPGGLVVDRDFRIPNPDSPTQDLDPTAAVSNWLVETRKNNKKRSIQVLRNEYLYSIVEEAKEIVEYRESSQYSDENGKVAFNNLL